MNTNEPPHEEVKKYVIPKYPPNETKLGCMIPFLLLLLSPFIALGYYCTLQIGIGKTLLGFGIAILLTPFLFLIPWFLYASQKHFQSESVKEGILKAEKAKRRQKRNQD